MAAHYQIEGGTAAEISASVETGVRTGALPSGAALPAVRALAGQLAVSPATVAKAYQALRQRGLVETAGRHGTRVRPRPPVAASRSALRLPAPAGALDLSTGEPDYRLLPPLGPHLAALGRAAGTPIGYADAGVLPELADLAGRRLAADGVPVDAITVTSGALDGIERLLTAHLRPGDPVAVEDPGWANLLDLVAALGLQPVGVPVDDARPDPGRRTGRAGRRRTGARGHQPGAEPDRCRGHRRPGGDPARAARRPPRPAADRGRPRRRTRPGAAAQPRRGDPELGLRPLGQQAVRPGPAPRGARRGRGDRGPGGRPDAGRRRLGLHPAAAARHPAVAGPGGGRRGDRGRRELRAAPPGPARRRWRGGA